MSKVSYIGFYKKRFKSVKYNHKSTKLVIGDFIKFYYGVDGSPNQKPIIGKITKICDKGVETETDYGWMHAKWDRISRHFVIKTAGKLKESNIPSVTGLSPLPLLDAAITRLINKTKQTVTDISISDNRKNKKTSFSRKTVFKYKRNKIILIIDDNNSTQCRVQGLPSKKKSDTFLNVKDGKVSYFMYNKIYKAIKELK